VSKRQRSLSKGSFETVHSPIRVAVTAHPDTSYEGTGPKQLPVQLIGGAHRHRAEHRSQIEAAPFAALAEDLVEMVGAIHSSSSLPPKMSPPRTRRPMINQKLMAVVRDG
jgi:hypothetical protein